ncbi:MAG: response regulator [Bacteroidales bacterium]|nr:response regulator [Bacteroidales bacterium]MCF8406111.1 response regulator [Bacteroidales bacterium]
MNSNIYILVVDDNLENLKVVSNLLKDKEYKIALAQDGESALKVLEENKIDLILLDIMMPEMDGYEVCAILKSKPETKDIPIIFLSAKMESEDIVKGFQMGGVDYITKPFNREELIARVNNHIQLKLVRDCLKEAEKETKRTRDYFIKVLYDLGKVLDKNK